VKIAVKDANVLIDLLEVNLLGAWFKLGIATHVPDFVMAEVHHPQQRLVLDSFVSAGLLQVSHIGLGDMRSLAEVARLSRELGISVPDASAIQLAASLPGSVLLTGDGRLRRGAEQRGQVVRGLLWVLDMLLWQHVLSYDDGLAALARVIARNSRQPPAECERRRAAWGEGRKLRPVGL
jgi:predicted nucleic acid-binding protein